MGRPARKSYALEDLARYFKDQGMEARFWQFEANCMLHVLVRPDIGQAHALQYCVQSEVVTDPAPWYDIWWVRLLRWVENRLSHLNAKTKKHWHLPLWLRRLVYAQHINVAYRKEALPRDTLERIQAMRHYLMYQGAKPTKVIIGARAMMTLRNEVIQGYSDYYPVSCSNRIWIGEHIFGLKIQINPFLAEDAVIVC